MAYRDFYEDYDLAEPSVYDEKVEEFKDLLRAEVKDEITDRLAVLEKENDDLREKVANVGRLEREAEALKRELEYSIKNAERSAKQEFNRMKLDELMGILTKPKYKIETQNTPVDKCDKCDRNRFIEYTTPLGRKDKEPCLCARATREYILKEEVAVEVKRDQRNQGEYKVWYAPHMQDRNDSDGYISAKWVNDPSGMTLEEQMAGYYGLGFSDRDEAQKLADALNERAQAKEEAW